MPSLIGESQILEVLRRQNRWWSENTVSDELAPRRFWRSAFYEVRSWLNQPALKRAIILSGARRVGKTVILHQIAMDAITRGVSPRKVLYITFEDLTLTQTDLRSILALYERNVEPIDQESLILIDEIHYAKDWGRSLMVIMREFPQARVVATGSAAVVLSVTSRNESAAGRSVTVHVPTLSFYEYLHLRREDAPELPGDLTLATLPKLTIKQRDVIRGISELLGREFNRYLLQGGFPAGVADSLTLSRAQRLIREDVIDKALKRDMAYLYRVRNLDTLDQLFVYLCFNSGAIVERNTIAREMRVSASTVERHLQHLEEAHLVYRLDPFRLSGKKSLKPRPKVYIADATLRNAVILRGEGLFTNEEETSAVIESTVFKHLYALYYPEGPRFGYWRDPRSDREVDFLMLFRDGTRLACEVKYRTNPTLKPNEGLHQLLKSNLRPEQAFVITKHSEHFGPIEGGQIVQIPATLFTYLVGQLERERWFSEMPLSPQEPPYGQKSQPLSGEAVKYLPRTERTGS